MAQPFVPVTNGLQVVLQFAQQDGSEAINEFWVKRTGAWTTGLIDTMLDAFVTWFGTGDGTHTYRGTVAADNSLVELTGRDFTTQTGLVVSTNAGLPIAGDGGDHAAMLGATFALTARTGLAGRSYRGRTYLIGLPPGFWENFEENLVNPTFAAHLVLAFNSLITAVTTADAEASLVVCSRIHNGAARETGVMTPVIAYGYHNLNTDFQRRRAPAHSRHH